MGVAALESSVATYHENMGFECRDPSSVVPGFVAIGRGEPVFLVKAWSVAPIRLQRLAPKDVPYRYQRTTTETHEARTVICRQD